MSNFGNPRSNMRLPLFFKSLAMLCLLNFANHPVLAATDTDPTSKCSINGSGDGVKKRRCTNSEVREILKKNRENMHAVAGSMLDVSFLKMQSADGATKCTPDFFKTSVGNSIGFAQSIIGANIIVEDDVIVLEEKSWLARTYNSTAEKLLNEGCRDLAKSVYLSVIDDFPGSAFASYRQRAQIGIDDIRAMK